eukprot:COSAG05_NODE_2104_length_3554_cov_6.450362_5_plen_220_part_00
MASDAPLAAAELFPQLNVGIMAAMLTEDKAQKNWKMWQFYAVPAAIFLAGIYGHFFGDWSSVGLDGWYPIFLICFGAWLALVRTGKIKVDEAGLTYTTFLCLGVKYPWNELNIEFTRTEPRTYKICPACFCCPCEMDRDSTPSGVAVLITGSPSARGSAAGRRVATLTYVSHLWHGRTLEQVAARFNELKAGAVGQQQSKDVEAGYVPPVIAAEPAIEH